MCTRRILPPVRRKSTTWESRSLGICYGSQLMAHQLGGSVETAPVSEYGKTEVKVDNGSLLFGDVSPKTICWMSHTDYIAEAPEGFRGDGPHAGLPGGRHGAPG